MPKERLLPYIILGIVKHSSPITGQAITKQFDNEIGEFGVLLIVRFTLN